MIDPSVQALPVLHRDDIQSELSELLSKERDHFLFVFHGTSDALSVAPKDFGEFPVYAVASELALRRQLLALPDNDARAVFLVPWREGLPLDLAGRFALRGRVRVVGKEARLKRLLGGVRSIENRLLRSPLVDYLLAHEQSQTLSLGELEVSERKLWETWLSRVWGLDTAGGLALDTFLASAADSGRGRSFDEAMTAAPKVLEALLAFLGETLGPAGPVVLRAWMAGQAERALELALVCEALQGVETAAAWLRKQVRDLLHVQDEDARERVARQLAAAVATALPVYALGRERKTALRALFERAEALVDDSAVRSALVRSTRLPSGFRLRLDALGAGLLKAATEPGPIALAPVLEAKALLEAHASYVDEARETEVRRADMAVRLLAWLCSDRAELEPTSLDAADADVARLGRWYVEQGGFVDWARSVARGPSQTPFDKGVQAVVKAADALRQALDLRFARALAPWISAHRPAHQVVPIDQAMRRVVAPFLEGHAERKLLVLLLDGMAWAQAAEIISSLGEQGDGWGPMAWHARGRALKLGDARTPVVLAGIPTVTDVSRSAFFAGKPMASGKLHPSEQDPERLRDNPALKPFFDGAEYPRLFLRGAGHEAHGVVSQAALTAIADRDQRAVGVVINAIDASLKGDSQQWHTWRVENVRSLPELLVAARQAGRSVLLASDHGHVPSDLFEIGLAAEGGGARWRPLARAADEVRPFEVKLRGEGVWLPKGAEAVALLADDKHRYGGAPHRGEHGGATLAEVIAPCVLIHWDDPQGAQADPDRTARALFKPEWWLFEVQPMATVANAPALPPDRPSASPGKRRKDEVSENQLALLPELAAPPPVAEASVAAASTPPAKKPQSAPPKPLSPMAQVLSELPEIKALSATERKQVLEAVEYLLEKGGMAQLSALAARLGMPEFHVRGFVARKLQRTLNVDGFQVVTYDQSHVRLARDILVQQFGVEP